MKTRMLSLLFLLPFLLQAQPDPDKKALLGGIFPGIPVPNTADPVVTIPPADSTLSATTAQVEGIFRFQEKGRSKCLVVCRELLYEQNMHHEDNFYFCQLEFHHRQWWISKVDTVEATDIESFQWRPLADSTWVLDAVMSWPGDVAWLEGENWWLYRDGNFFASYDAITLAGNTSAEEAALDTTGTVPPAIDPAPDTDMPIATNFTKEAGKDIYYFSSLAEDEGLYTYHKVTYKCYGDKTEIIGN